jgi:hypothetical protein
MEETPQKPKQDSLPVAESVKKSRNRPTKWQERLLPLMINFLIALALFFFVATFVQISYLHWSILQYPHLNIDVPTANSLGVNANSFEEQLSAQKLYLLTKLEAYLVERRYHEANLGLMSSIWFRYLGFITGMILALIGASFVLGRLQEPETEITATSSKFSTTLKTTSPGIILAVLGAVLMLATIMDKDTRNITDANIYLSSTSISQTYTLPTPKPVDTNNLAAPKDRP